MKNQKNITNLLIASALVVVITVFGLVTNSKIQADVIYPGYSSVQVQLKVKSTKKQDFEAEIKLLPTDQTKKYNFKKRTFTVEAGETTINWTVRKVLPGTKKIVVSSTAGTFSPSSIITSLPENEKASAGPFRLDLTGGDNSAAITVTPALTQTPRSTFTPVASATASIPVPAVPAAPAATSATASNDYLSLPGGL